MANILKNIKIKIDRDTKNRYFKNIEYPSIPINPNDIYIVTTTTDRLDLLANDYYNDPQLWWVISRANPGKVSRDSFFINPGVQIRIPQNIERIYNSYKELNK